MDTLAYPSKGFVKNVIIAIKNSHEIKIIVLPGWRKKIILTELPGFLHDKVASNSKRSWKFIFGMFLVSHFLTAYFYARSGGYTASYMDGDELIVNLKPPGGSSSVGWAE